VNERKRPSGTPNRKGAKRDLLTISAVALALLFLGVAFDAFERVRDWVELHTRVQIDNVFAVLLVLSGAFCVFGIRQWLHADRERDLRTTTEERFRSLVEQLPAVTYTWVPTQPTGDVAPPYVSPQIERLLGFESQEWSGDPRLWIERLHPEDRERVVAASNRADRAGTPFLEEYRTRTKDGRYVWIRDEAVVVERDASGRPTLVQGVMFDITERKEAEARLQEAENRYRTIVERVPAVAYTWDSADAPDAAPTLYISPQIHQLLGYQAEEWRRDPSLWSSSAHPDDREPVLAAWAEASEKGDPFAMEYRLRNRDGRIIWVRDEAVPVSTGARGRAIYQGVMFDITEQKEAEQRFRRLVEQLPVVTYLATSGGGRHRTLYMAPGIRELTGDDPHAWTGSDGAWEERLHPDDRERVRREDDRTDRSEDRFELEYRLLRADGDVVWVRDTAVLVDRDGPEGPTWQGVLEDITARRSAEEQLGHARERYRHLVERLPAAVYIDAVDDVSSAVYISPQYEALTGYTPKERLDAPELWTQILHPEDRERVLTESIRTNETGDPFDIEYRIVSKDGRTVWVHDQANLVEMPDGIRAWQGVLTDVTEAKEALDRLSRRDRILEAASFAAERLLSVDSWNDVVGEVLARVGAAAGASRAAVYRNTPREDGRLCLALVEEWTTSRVSGFAGRIEGQLVSFEEAGLGRWPGLLAAGEAIHGSADAFPPDEAELLRSVGIRSLAAIPIGAGGEWWGHVVCDQADEERTWQDAELDALRVVANTFGAAIGRERASRRLSETEARYRSLIEQIPAITYMESATEPGKKLYISPQVESILGVRDTSWSHEGWLGRIHPDDRERVREEDDRTGRTGEPFSVEYRMQRPDGDVVWIQDDAVLLRDDRGTPLYWQGVRFDITSRKEAEEQLREAEERYRRLVEQMPAITYVDERPEEDDAPWSTTYISPQVAAILGYEPEEFAEDPALWRRIVHPEDRDRALAADLHHYETGEPLATEFRLLAKDGSVRWLRDEATTLPGPDGRPRLSQGILIDVTETKLAEQQLQEAQERYRSLIETIPAATYIDTVDAISQALYMSPQVEQIYGYTPEEWKTQPWLWEQGLHPDDHDEVVAAVDRHNRDGVPYEAEYRFRHRDGHWVWVRDQAVMIHDETGGHRFSQGVVIDVTAAKQAEDQLREAEERFRAIVEHVPAAIYLDRPDESLQTEYISPQIEDLTGISAEEWRARPEAWVEAIHPIDRDEILRSYRAAVDAKRAWAEEYRMRTRDGRTIWVRDETTFLHDEHGDPTYMQGVIWDVTERRLAEQALRESEQREREAAERLRALDEMKNTFLAAVSHELRSPLTSILGLSLTLERSELEETDRNDLLQRLAANARKLDRLLKDLLDIDRLNRGIVEPQYRTTDVGALVRRTVENLDALGDRTIQVQAQPATMSVDAAKVERIVENLLMNAARHTSTGRTIWLRVEREPGGVLIVVEDDGEGVPEEMRQAIFEPFRQGTNTAPHAPGTGIGLSLVARFSQLHGGRAWVQEREGGGASFRVFLPDGPGDGAPDGAEGGADRDAGDRAEAG
jgi:PAS domain S-box-containing protein